MTHKTTFTPRYHAAFIFIAWPTIGLMLLGLAITLSFGYIPGSGWVIPLLVVILTIQLILGFGLINIKVGESHLTVRFGLYARKISLTEISEIETVTIKWWQRVGLLARPTGIIIADGLSSRAVRLHFSNGTTLTLSVANPQKLITALSANQAYHATHA